jgi:cytochrome P450
MHAETPVESKRKIRQGEPAPGCPVQARADQVWRVQDYPTARAFLRGPGTLQAGFNAENVVRLKGRMRIPVLYRDGAEHREHRRQTAKYFTPRRVDSAYRGLMGRLADEQCDVLRSRGEADLWRLAFSLAVNVTCEIIGLTDGRGSTAIRLNRFFENIPDGRVTRTPRSVWTGLRSNFAMASFYWRDVRPSVAARRRRPQDDLITHLIEEGCSNGEILGECVTFGAAGMVTTREFVTLAAWHLFTDDDLRRAYVTGEEKERVALLHELLRLDPIITDLYRWTTDDLELGGRTVPAGAKVNVSVAAANMDPGAVGPDPGAVCPARSRADGVGDAGLSFGDGAHRCPGAHIAIQETDIFLTKLFALPGLRMVREPTVRLRPEIASFELAGLRVVVDAG